jgi:hypothetical protein
MKQEYLKPTQNAGRDFVMRKIQGNVIMLNLLRFRAIADYSSCPEIKPDKTISGEEAYHLYINHTIPFLKASGGEILFMGKGGTFLIGPDDEKWDVVLLIRQKSTETFLAFENNQEYLKGIGHRTAALEDSRLLPISEIKMNTA